MQKVDSGKCSWGQCGRTARWQIGLMVWALGMPAPSRTSKNCAKMLTGVTICDECRPNVKAEHFLLPEGRERIMTGFSRAGAALPDLSNAKLDFVEIVDKPIDPIEMALDAQRHGGKIYEA